MSYEMMVNLWDENARIERVIFIGGAIAAGDVMADDFDSFLDEEDEEDISRCLGEIPEWVDIDGRGYERAEGVFDWLRDARKLGYLVKFATPVMTPTGKDSCSFSWGYYNTRWIYAESMEAAVELGMDWVAERRKAEREKAEKESAS